MKKFNENITLSHYEYDCILSQMSSLAKKAGSVRMLIHCAQMHLDLVVTSVTIGDESDLAYEKDYKHSRAAESLLSQAHKIRGDKIRADRLAKKAKEKQSTK